MATFATTLALRDLRPVWIVEIGGIGRRTGATVPALQNAYRFCTENPYDLGINIAICDPYLDCLLPPEGATLDEGIDLRSGSTQLGAYSFALLDLPIRDLGGGIGSAHGWAATYPISDMLGIAAPTTTWTLNEDIDATETNWLLVSTAGLVAGMALWIGAETVIVDAVFVGNIDVIRGAYNSEAQPHPLAPYGEGTLYDRPQHWRGRDVRLYLNLVTTTTGDLLDYAEARLVWRGMIEDWECRGDSPGIFSFCCRSAVGRLDQCIGRRQLTGAALWGGANIDRTETAMRDQNAIQLTVDRDKGPLVPESPDYPLVAGLGYFHARHGNQVVQCQYAPGTQAAERGQIIVQRWGLLDTPIEAPSQQDTRMTFREVLVTDPDVGGSANARRFLDPAGEPFCHPIAIALSLITSTGWIVSGGVQNSEYDVLPATWGAALPVALIDLDSFEDRMKWTYSIRVPRLVIGWDGKPLALRSFLEEQLLGPFGWFLYLDESGLLALGNIAEVYPSETWPAITEDDIWLRTDERGNAIGPEISLSGELTSTVGQQTWRYDYDFAEDEPRKVLKYQHVQTFERGASDDSDLTWDVRGLSETGTAEAQIRAVAMSRARWFISPRPRVRAAILLDRLAATLTQGVRLTCSFLPNPFTGGRGMTLQPAAIVNRAVDLGSGLIWGEMLLLPEPNVGLWVPSGQVIGYAGGANPVLTLSANRYTTSEGGPGEAPDSDAEAFTPGAAGVGDICMLVDFDGQILCDDTARVTALGVNTVTLSNEFHLGVPVVVPAGAWPWDHIVFCHYSAAGGVPAAAWTDTMKYHVAQADDATGLMPGGDDANVYGGS